MIGLNLMMVMAIAGHPDGAARIEVTGPWQIHVSAGVANVAGRRVKIAREATLEVAPAELVTVKDEEYNDLPEFDEHAGGWIRGARAHGLIAEACTALDMLNTKTFTLRPSPGDATPFKPGVDYRLDDTWATFGRLPGSRIGPQTKVYASYEYGRGRLDSIVVDRSGNATLLRGTPHVANPYPPAPPPGSVTIANVWVPGRLAALTTDNLYPILALHYPHPARNRMPVAATLLPKSWAKLRAGKPLSVLAWGDSVTDGGAASDVAHRYQSRFVTRLGARFKSASITLTTCAWGGRCSDNFLHEPPGSPHNFEEQIIARHPDLILMEFVNDAYMTAEQVEERYSWFQKRFQEIGAEWIIITPHYVRPDWMGAASVRVEEDPRPFVAALKAFGARHKVAIADASPRWGHLLREGIPYITLLSNNINHPDDRGHELFADALMALFE
jgi:lysophospholipase L1-like esterase